MVPPLLKVLIPIAQELAASLEIPIPLVVNLLLARVEVRVLHRAPVPLEVDYRVTTSAILPVPLLAEHASAHLLSGAVVA